VETVKAAAANPALNWVIKIHPANVVKDARDGHLGKPSELLAVERVLPSLPDHIKIISADSAVNTLTLIKCMDFCVTVRGTAGIEAAMFGKLVVTAGTGRYDCRGFTLDPQSKHDYLQLLGELHKQEPPSAKQIELAQRYAWGVFISRPLEMETARFYYEKNASASIRVEIGANAPEMLDSANDLNRLAKWFDDPSKDDFQSTA
jgi:capsule polysaccharide export protein KpsC/LpsZ